MAKKKVDLTAWMRKVVPVAQAVLDELERSAREQSSADRACHWYRFISDVLLNPIPNAQNVRASTLDILDPISDLTIPGTFQLIHVSDQLPEHLVQQEIAFRQEEGGGLIPAVSFWKMSFVDPPNRCLSGAYYFDEIGLMCQWCGEYHHHGHHHPRYYGSRISACHCCTAPLGVCLLQPRR